MLCYDMLCAFMLCCDKYVSTHVPSMRRMTFSSTNPSTASSDRRGFTAACRPRLGRRSRRKRETKKWRRKRSRKRRSEKMKGSKLERKR